MGVRKDTAGAGAAMGRDATGMGGTGLQPLGRPELQSQGPRVRRMPEAAQVEMGKEKVDKVDRVGEQTERGGKGMGRGMGQGKGIEDVEEELVIEKSNVLCLGPTGVGKTLMVRTLAKILDVPFSMSDCTPFTMAGYIGEDVDMAVHRLLIAANYDVRKAESGIICLDEFDKIAKPKSMHGVKDISGEGVQQALLKIIEGTNLTITTKERKNPPSSIPPGLPNSPAPGSFNHTGGKGNESIMIDTSNILFIFTGAFIGLDKIITDRLASGSMGFNAHVRDSSGLSSDPTLLSKSGLSSSITGAKKLGPLELAEPADLISFGIIPEMVGRIPVTTSVEALTEEMLVRVLTEPRNAILRQYEQLFKLSGVELKFTTAALREVAKSALGMGTGARGLRTVVERLLGDAMFESPGTSIKHILITSSVAKRLEAPLYFSRGQGFKFQELYEAEEYATNSASPKFGKPNGPGDGTAGNYEEPQKLQAVGFA
ncbi:Similar to Mitochondrial clpX-like chaperone MCX1; acc. no. P38323 [Pyronema omphalodes CBS 100304]|uniref:Similar to Mitochondrial clpX-like chaperone MCX1 acc. no. P38323 n=1 Tax=Pyronema omphalodes (strain CBS 100304) TaxID=1076935 RepID=U4L8G9_PYROM|nr:Similar to Mitochondrial clpX-like chaperone MCX1; acc. no. P38323 [Pyronema omphalodes CBS 100304]